MIEEEEVIAILREHGAIKKGHFELSSGRHTDTYLQCAVIFQYPDLTNMFALNLAEHYQDRRVDVVVAPAVGGIILGYALAQIFCCRIIFTEREAGKMALRREFTISQGEKVVVAEDVVTTGASVKEVIDLVGEAGGDVVGVSSLLSRGEKRVFQEPFYFLAEVKAESYVPEECPLCKEGIPLQIPGSRKLEVLN